MTRHGYGFRFSLFALIGGLVFIAGLGLQVVLVRYANVGADWSYAAQAIFSIELSYLLNRYLTWRDRSARFWAAAWKFNAQKLLMTVINLTAYALLVRAGMEYIVANVVLTAIFTPVNYFAADLLVFVRGKHTGAPEHAVEPRLPEVLPTVSIVIPCKGSERTIRSTVDSFLGQDYPALSELILVGDVNDSTWEALADVDDSRLVLIEQEQTPGRRDPNVKRDKGIRKSAGDVIALADSDIVVDPGWLGRAIALLNGQGGGLVAGGIRSINDTFWGRFVDNNVMAAKTPRVPRPYRVTAKNFGARGCKPPITANAVFTRGLYDSVQLDTSWSYGYEDYEWFWRLARDGHAILFASELTASHHHRRSFRQLVREYRQSAHGCAQFIRVHPDSPLARKRAVQAFGLPTLALGAVSMATLAAATGYGTLVAGLLVMAATMVTGREVARARSLEGLTYAPAALALGGVYAATIAGNLIRPAVPRLEAPTWEDSTAATGMLTLERPVEADEPTDERDLEAPSRDRPPRRPWRQRISWPLTVILAVQAGLSLALVWRNTAFGDEGLYLWAGHIELEHYLTGAPLPVGEGGRLNFQDYFSGAPQIYPPLGAIADNLGHLAAARILSLFFMLGATVFLYLIARRLFGLRVAIVACGLWATTEPSLKLGAFATFDPMAIFLISMGTWLAILAGRRRFHGELIALSAAVLAFGSLTAYSYLIYIPLVIAVAAISWIPAYGRRKSLISATWLAGSTLLLFSSSATVLKLWAGLSFTVLNRQVTDPQGYLSVVDATWSWQGIVTCLAVAGALLAVVTGQQRLLIIVLAGSCFVVPFQQARIQTGVSLDKHLSLGIWLASMAAGYGVIALLRAPKSRLLLVACSCALFAIPAVMGESAAQWSFQGWNNSTDLVAAFNKVSGGVQGEIAVENFNDAVLRYYTSSGRNWALWGERWTGITLSTAVGAISPGQRTADIAQYKKSLHASDYGMVIVSFNQPDVYSLTQTTFTANVHAGASAYNQEVVRLLAGDPELSTMVDALLQDPDYRISAVVPYGRDLSEIGAACVIWRKVPHSTVPKTAPNSGTVPKHVQRRGTAR